MGGSHMSPQKKKSPVVPILVGLLVVAVGVIIFLVVSQNKPAEKKEVKKVEVPDVLYMEQAEAEAELTKVGLKLGTVTEEDYIVGGYILETDPVAGTSVKEGSKVNVIVSVGQDVDAPIEVPDLTGLSPEEAEAKLLELWLIPQPGEQIYSESVETGKVCAQSVAPGTTMTMFDTITYSTSLGKEQVAVPDVTGKPVAEARSVLNNVGLSTDTVTSYSDTVAKDVVISQSVAKDTQVTKGTTITIEISLGKKPAAKVVVPNIISYNLADAKKALESAGLKYTYTGDEDGTVISVNPAANTQVDQGSSVTFELKKPEPIKPDDGNKDDDKDDDNKDDDGFGEGITKDQATKIATDALDVYEPTSANNVKTSDLITGGGTKYYYVELDLDGAHYKVKVDALDAIVLEIVETADGIENTYDGDWNLLISTEAES